MAPGFEPTTFETRVSSHNRSTRASALNILQRNVFPIQALSEVGMLKQSADIKPVSRAHTPFEGQYPK